MEVEGRCFAQVKLIRICSTSSNYLPPSTRSPLWLSAHLAQRCNALSASTPTTTASTVAFVAPYAGTLPEL